MTVRESEHFTRVAKAKVKLEGTDGSVKVTTCHYPRSSSRDMATCEPKKKEARLDVGTKLSG